MLLMCGICTAWVANADAAVIDSYELNVTEGYVDVEGHLDYDGDVSVLIQYQNSTMDAYDTCAFYQKKTNADKSFSYRLYIPKKDADIKLLISGSNQKEKADKADFYFPSFGEYQNALELFTSYAGIKSVFEDSENAEYVKMLNFDTELLSKLTNKDIVYRSLAEKTAAMENLEEDFDEVLAHFNTLCEINTIAESGDGAAALEIIADSKNIKLADSKTYAVYTYGKYGNQYQGDVFAGMKNPQGYTSLTAFYDAFDKAAILGAVKNLLNWEDVTPVLKLAANCLDEIDFSGYDALEDHAGEVDQKIALASEDCLSVSDLVQKYNAAVKEVYEKYYGDPGEGSGGGFGGGFGGGVAAGGPATRYEESDAVKEAVDEKAAATTFTDLDQAEWAMMEIQELIGRKIISGYADNSFKPNNYITRSEFVKLLVLASGLDVSDAENGTYKDVTTDHWSYGYVEAASRAGIVMGTGDGIFAPDSLITREEISVMLYRAMTQKGVDCSYESQAEFTDWKAVSDWATEAVTALSGIGMIHGYEDGEFAPGQNATRAETAVMIYRMMQKI